MTSLVKKTYSLTQDMVNNLETLKNDKGFSTISMALQYCISEAYERHLRNEKRVKKTDDVDEKLTIEERRKKREEKRCRAIAEQLEGEVTDGPDGLRVEYYTHSKQGSFKQVVPLLSLTDDLVKKQWFPSKEEVQAYWNKNKED